MFKKYMHVILPAVLLPIVQLLPANYGVFVGINNYPGTANDLLYAVNDAEDVRQALIDVQGWNGSNMELVLNTDASETAIKSKISAMPKGSNKNFFYFSGHGDSWELGGTDGLIPANSIYARITTYELDDRLTNYQSYGNFATFLEASGSGIFPDNSSMNGFWSSSCWMDEVTYDKTTWQHGIYSKFVIEGLTYSNSDANTDGYLSAEELHNYAKTKTHAYEPRQNPLYADYYPGSFILGPAGSQPIPIPPPSAPTGLDVTNPDGYDEAVQLDWNGVYRATSYKVYRRYEGGSWSYIASTSYSDYDDYDVMVNEQGDLSCVHNFL